MIKKIKVDQLRCGMFVHDFNCGWLHHPFLGNKITIKDEKSIEKVIEKGIHEVYIDTDKGLDIADTSTEEEVNQEIQKVLIDVIDPEPETEDNNHIPVLKEISKAKEIEKVKEIRMEKELFNIGLIMTFNVKGCDEHLWTRLIGVESTSLFITKLPYIEGKPLSLSRGNSCLIRFIKNGTAYGLEAEVVFIQYHPIPLIFFKYPINIYELPLRQHKRFIVNIPAKILIADSIMIEATITNISENGCLLIIPIQKDKDHEIKEELTLNKSCKLTFNIINQTVENLECIVRNNRTEEQFLLFGMQFNNIIPENKGIINSLISVLSCTEI
jgi:hypothetical protein